MKIVVVVAHPDDESFGCGSVLARAASTGATTTVLCATRGEAGESRVRTGDLAGLREAELREAARILGVETVLVLDYEDSGMTGEPSARSLAAAVPAQVAAEVRSVIDEIRRDVVVTLDASDGHRDHAAIRDATLVAVDTSQHPSAATYLVCLARSSMHRWSDHMRGVGGEAYLSQSDLGTPDAEITTLLDARGYLATRWAAIHAHASQASPYDDLPPELQEDFLATDRLKLVRGDDLLGS